MPAPPPGSPKAPSSRQHSRLSGTRRVHSRKGNVIYLYRGSNLNNRHDPFAVVELLRAQSTSRAPAPSNLQFALLYTALAIPFTLFIYGIVKYFIQP